MHQPRVSRKGDRFFPDGRVDNHLGKVGRLGCSRPGRGRKALLNEGDELVFSHLLAPARHRAPVEGELMLEELLAAEQLIIGILDPTLAQNLVREISFAWALSNPAYTLQLFSVPARTDIWAPNNHGRRSFS
jgi:hypothetical protein